MIFFAWVPAGTAFSSSLERQDEDVFALEITQSEDDFPSAQIDIRNPRIGLLNPGREVWAWISEGDGVSAATPLILGRLVAIPEDLHAEEVRLAFIARPLDYDEQKRTLAAASKVRPYWDAVWVAPDRRDEPESILEFRPQLFHVNRVTHDVTLTDIITGEDGTVVFSADDHFYDDVSVSYGPPPARKVRMEATVSWRQQAMGSVDLSATLGVDKGYIKTLTGQGLAEDWPKKGARIGGGWRVGESFVTRADGTVFPEDYEETVLLDGRVGGFPVSMLKPHFEADYEVSRNYTEKLAFELEADVQPIVTEPGDEEVILVTLASSEIEQPIDPPDTENPEGTLPIGDRRRRSYFRTDRGKESLEALISIARAKLLARARVVEVSFATDWQTGLSLSCRKNAQILDDRLPGGQASGKIIGYSLTIDGDSGERLCRVTMGCTIGEGNTVTSTPGTPDYVEAGYVVAGYQTYTGAAIMPIAGEVTYTDFTVTPNDDGVNFFDLRPADVVEDLKIINGYEIQKAVLKLYEESRTFAGFSDLKEAVAAVNEVYTEIDLTLKPLNKGPFETEIAVTVSGLMVPKTIDLAAGAV